MSRRPPLQKCHILSNEVSDEIGKDLTNESMRTVRKVLKRSKNMRKKSPEGNMKDRALDKEIKEAISELRSGEDTRKLSKSAAHRARQQWAILEKYFYDDVPALFILEVHKLYSCLKDEAGKVIVRENHWLVNRARRSDDEKDEDPESDSGEDCSSDTDRDSEASKSPSDSEDEDEKWQSNRRKGIAIVGEQTSANVYHQVGYCGAKQEIARTTAFKLNLKPCARCKPPCGKDMRR